MRGTYVKACSKCVEEVVGSCPHGHGLHKASRTGWMGVVMGRFRKKGRLFKVEFTIWIDERSCLHSDGTTDRMAIYEALVVDTEYDGWVLDWKENEMRLISQEEDNE